MGFFSSILDAAAEANDEVHGQRLLDHVMSTLQSFESLDRRVLAAVSIGYLQIRERINLEMVNWTRDGRIRIARQMQDQARQALDTDVAGSYAKWLAGAWLESGERKSQKARVALNTLNMYESELRQAIVDAKEPADKEVTRLHVNTPCLESSTLEQISTKSAKRHEMDVDRFGPRLMANVNMACPDCNHRINVQISSIETVKSIRCPHCTTVFTWRRFPKLR